MNGTLYVQKKDEITAYIDSGYTVRTGNNIAYCPDAKIRPNSITVA